jgi:hypothetical protein
MIKWSYLRGEKQASRRGLEIFCRMACLIFEVAEVVGIYLLGVHSTLAMGVKDEIVL